MFVHHTNLEDHASDRRKLVCYDCGVACDLEHMRSERADFLVKLGAKQRPVVQASVEQPARASKPRPPERPDQGQALRVRLAYRKLGRAAFSSHLDLVRLLPRLFRRLQLPMYYSLGFNSKPVLVFGPALSLGVASLAEYVDLKLVARDDIDWSALPARLSEAALDGLEFFEARPLEARDPKLSQLISEAGYVAGIARAALPELGFSDAPQLAAAVAARSAGELRTRRVIDGIGKWVDVHRYLNNVAVGEGDELLAEAGVVGDLIPISFSLRITEQGTAKASEALETLLGAREVPARIVRTRLGWRAGTESGTPLDLDRYRQHHVRAVALTGSAVRGMAATDSAPEG
jgi:radical SAM-linked protein